MSNIPQSTIAGFWGRVDKENSKIFYNGTRCWELRRSGRYASVRVGSKSEKANRFSWMITHGEIPNGLFVLHHCDNTYCVNPDHLFLGTQQDNVNDMIAKKRKWIGSGEDNPNRKLTIEQVEEIRKLYRRQSHEYGIIELAKRYGISTSQIHSILKRGSWK